MQASGPRARGEMYVASSKSAGNWRLHERARDELEAEQRQTEEEALVEGDEQQAGGPEVIGCNHFESHQEQGEEEEEEEEEGEEESESERNQRLLAARARPVCALGTRAHLRRQHAPTCSSSKLVTGEPSQKLQHHCLRHHRHKPNCAALRQNLQLHAELAPRQDHHSHNHNTKHSRVRPNKQLISARPLHKTSGQAQLDSKYLLRVAAKQQQQQKRQHNKQLASFIKSFDAPPTAREAKVTSGSQTTTTTTMKFISQLYFLIHLSAMISLLLHHKNLVSSERRASYATAASHTMSLRRAQLANQSQLMGSVMPEPQMQMAASGNANNLSANKTERRVRSISGEQANEPTKSSDILVRLVGRPHARCALQYFLCYLLASSIAILLLLWLIRICAAHSTTTTTTTTTARTLSTSDEPSKSSRQDCTPVLIGSISLGLIQLIVIGLDIADNIDALAGNSTQAVDLARHWPILLPFLHFSFVSLLMQFILAKVAENRELIKSASDSRSVELTSGGGGGGDSGALQPSRRAIGSARRQSSAAADSKRRADNLQNIALAHLLVTHILLWLMKLNSIGSLQPSDSLDHLASVPSATLGAPIHLAPPWPTSGNNQVVVTSDETKRKSFPIDTTNGQNNGNQLNEA